MAVGMIKDCVDRAPSKTTVWKIKEVAWQFKALKIQFVQREGNLIADFLAKTCETIDADVRIIDIPSAHIRKLLLDG